MNALYFHKAENFPTFIVTEKINNSKKCTNTGSHKNVGKLKVPSVLLLLSSYNFQICCVVLPEDQNVYLY